MSMEPQLQLWQNKQNVSPQNIVDKYHNLNKKVLFDLGCSWENNIDSRGIEFGGSLFNRTKDLKHKEIVQDNFKKLLNAGLFEQKTMQQYFEVSDEVDLPDRYIEGECPTCGEDGAGGDQCDSCGATYGDELKNPKSKMNPNSQIEIRDTEHFFYRLDCFKIFLKHKKGVTYGSQMLRR